MKDDKIKEIQDEAWNDGWQEGFDRGVEAERERTKNDILRKWGLYKCLKNRGN